MSSTRRPPNLSLGRRSTVPDVPKRQSYSSLDKLEKKTDASIYSPTKNSSIQLAKRKQSAHRNLSVENNAAHSQSNPKTGLHPTNVATLRTINYPRSAAPQK